MHYDKKNSVKALTLKNGKDDITPAAINSDLLRKTFKKKWARLPGQVNSTCCIHEFLDTQVPCTYTRLSEKQGLIPDISILVAGFIGCNPA